MTIDVAVSKVKDDLTETEEFKNQIKNESAGTEKMGDISKSISSLKNDVTGLQTNVSNNRTSFSNLKQNLEEMKAGDLETRVNELNAEVSNTRISFNNLKRNLEEVKARDLEIRVNELKANVGNMETKFSKLRQTVDSNFKWYMNKSEERYTEWFNELSGDLSEVGKDVSRMATQVKDLKEKMDDSKPGKAEKIMTVKDEPVKCKNCKTNPCLKGKLVTLGNFAELANCKDEDGDCGYIHMHKDGDCRYPNMQSEKRYFKYEHGGPFPLEHVKSLRYSC